MVEAKLLDALQLPKDTDEEEISSAITALLTSAVHDAEPPKSLSEIRQLIGTADAASLLDPLNTLPLLLRCDDPNARDIILLMGQHCSAKEAVMAAQESVEALEHAMEAEDVDPEDDNEGKKAEDGAVKIRSHISQLLVLIDVYALAIPRLHLRRKSAEETLRPLCKELEAVIRYASVQLRLAQGRSALSKIANLTTCMWKWVQNSVSAEAGEDIRACQLILKALLDNSLVACEQFLQASSAQRALEACFPRLAGRSRLDPQWEEGERIISELIDSYESLELRTDGDVRSCSAIDLLVATHRNWKEEIVDKELSFLLPALVSSIQSNSFLDQALAVLIRSLHARLSRATPKDLPEEIAVPLYSVVPSIASIHPDPSVRHQAFRVLSLLLSSESPRLRFQHLVELTGHSEYPPMRVAAVGLVKDSILRALSDPTKKDDPFLSPLFLRSFGPILFRPDPPDLFDSTTLNITEFQETHEPRRLAEALSLYYVLLQADQKNATGIRDKDVMRSIENNLLAPLRRNLEKWMDDPAVSQSHLHDIASIAALQISLERISDVQAKLNE